MRYPARRGQAKPIVDEDGARRSSLIPAEEVARKQQQKGNQQRLEGVGADPWNGDLGVSHQQRKRETRGG